MHCLVVGRTLSGKSVFAKKKIAALLENGCQSIVLDPTLDQEFLVNARFCTSDKQAFLRVFWASMNCAVFVDEAGICAGRHDEEMNKLATMGRHRGHKVFFITQRAKQVSTTIRSQCSEVVCFKQSLADTKDLSNEFVEKKLLEAQDLKQGEFFYVRNNEKTLKLNVFQL